MSYIIGEYIRNMAFILESPRDLDSDTYNNALLIQKCIKTLNENGVLSQIEKDILKGVSIGYNFAELSKLLKINKHAVSKTFKKTTDRIAYVLGGEFTDSAFFDRIGDLGLLEGEDNAKITTMRP